MTISPAQSGTMGQECDEIWTAETTFAADSSSVRQAPRLDAFWFRNRSMMLVDGGFTKGSSSTSLQISDLEGPFIPGAGSGGVVCKR